MERSEHPEGMLDRDQRTAKLRLHPQTYEDVVSVMNVSREETTAERSHAWRFTRRCGHRSNTFQFHSVANVLIVICLTLSTLPSISTAPTGMDSRMASREKWKNPCDTVGDSNVENPNPEVYNTTELNSIKDEAVLALNQAKAFRDNFVTKTFGGKSVQSVHTDLKEQKLSFLLDLPKGMGEKIPEDAKVETGEVLRKAFDTLQHVAVGLEQITWDQEDQGEFHTEFYNAEHHLKRVLCELFQVSEHHKIKLPVSVTRDIMDSDARSGGATEKMSRDWIIFRDYINALEYVIESMEEKIASLS